MILKTQIRAGTYFDSVVLMHLQRSLAGLPGVDDAGVVMATPANQELLAEFELLSDEGKAAGADDMLIVVRAETEQAAAQAIAQVDDLLKKRRSNVATEFRPHSLDGATKQLPQAEFVLISVPGRYAAGVAEQALELGKHVFLYSDNVEIADEIRLKEKGRAMGRLVMGPDCGTAILNGVGLGFANRVRRGDIGVVAASGTGLQAVTAGIHNLGGGVSQAFGTGGRDLKTDVGGTTALMALNVLARDDGTKVIVLVSKPPAAAVAARLLGAAQAMGKPVVVQFIGYPPPGRQVGNLHFAASLHEAAETALALAGNAEGAKVTEPRQGYLRGLFSGGTLAYEMMLGVQATLAPLYSNTPISADQKLDDVFTSKGHTIIDLGEDDFTQGRLHPMMDNDLRLRRLKEELEDPETGLILLDVVLGEGAHPDPASELAPAIAAGHKQRKDVEFVALVVGTDEDPQGLDKQVEQLESAGARIFRTTAGAVEYASRRLARPPEMMGTAVELGAFQRPLAAINVGLESFYESLKGQGAEAVHVDWRPPAGGNEKLMGILARLKTTANG
ncbi:MAG: acyl-CoA synthetase FdrA [Anaerolineae bacterium]|nr:MAG: acyl-CoA synthetase FdrA [Anaerolineae bacterium]